MQDDVVFSEENLPFVSVVICTFNRKKLLRKCLSSIFALNYPKSRYEIIVVDGGSNDGTEELCRQFPNVKLVIEKKSGLACARNRGAQLSRGSIIAYTDDDCIVENQWLRNLVAGFNFSKSVVGVGGPVCPLHQEIIPKNVFVLGPLGFYDEGKTMKFVPILVMPSAAFKREIFRIVQFDETLGVTKRGNLVLMGEDMDFCRNITKAGYKLLYLPQAKVYHQVILERLTVRYLLKHAFGNGIITAKYLLKLKNSRIWAVRIATSNLLQESLKSFSNRSFISCYRIVRAMVTLLASSSYLDEILVPTQKLTKKPSTTLQAITGSS